MGLFTRLAEQIVSSAMVNPIFLRTWMTEVERITEAAITAGRIYDSLSGLQADLAHAANTGALVIGDSAASDGLYRKSGASGSGTWIRVGGVPGYSFVVAADAGGTANAIAVTTALPVSGAQLITVPTLLANDGPPTVSFNGGTPLQIVTHSGNPPVPGGLAAGGEITGRISGSTFRLLSDQSSAAIQAAAEASANEARGYRDATQALYTTTITPNIFASKVVAEAYSPPAAPAFMQTAGRDAAGDKGRGLYKTVIAEPTHDGKFSITLDDMVTEAWFELADDFVRPEQFSSTPHVGLERAMSFAEGRNVVIDLTPGHLYDVASWPADGMVLSGDIRFRGNGAQLRGPDTATDFIRPTGKSQFEGVNFDRWGYVAIRELADAGAITGGGFRDCEASNLVGGFVNLECPVGGGFEVDRCRVMASAGLAGVAGASAIRIGTNDDTLQDTWTDVRITNCLIEDFTTNGTTENLTILLYGMQALVSGCRVFRTRSVDGACIPIYTKQRWSQLVLNRIVDALSTGTGGSSTDVVGLSAKGDTLADVSESPEGWESIVALNIVRRVGAQLQKGTGIRTQNFGNLVTANQSIDSGLNGYNINDSGGRPTQFVDNRASQVNVLAETGLVYSSSGTEPHVTVNHFRGFQVGARFDGLPVDQGGGLFGGLFEGNTIYDAEPTSEGVVIGSGIVRDLRLSNNSINVGGSVLRNDANENTGIQLVDNNTRQSAVRGATEWTGVRPAGTEIRDNGGYKSRATGTVVVPTGGSGLNVDPGLADTMFLVTGLTAGNTDNCNLTYTILGGGTFNIRHNIASSVEVTWTAETVEHSGL